MRIKKHLKIAPYTTFKIGGYAKYFAEVKNKDELVEAVSFAKKERLPIFVIGGGSDILVNDKDFDGLVIKYVGDKIVFKNNLVTAEAGVVWDDLVKATVEKDLGGIESLSGIPGTVGAAPVQNIGAYGQEVQDTFVSLNAYDLEKCVFVKFSKKDCQFDYRESLFKSAKSRGRFIICDVTFRLKKNTPPKVLYDSLKKYLAAKKIIRPTLLEVRQTVLDLRRQRLPNYRLVPNAGSFFKNPIIDKDKFLSLKNKYPDMPFFDTGSQKVKLFAGWLIEKAGWKGKKYKNAQVSCKNALVLLNPKGRAKASDVKELADKISQDVYKKFKVKLEPEVQMVGFEKKVAILGYGIEGQDAETFFKKQRAETTILDQKFDKNYLERLEKFDLIVRSPGVYRYLPEIVAAEKKDVVITSAIKLFFEKCPGKIIGVTGTKGKGTTATLIYEILKKDGKDVYLAGNIGKPYLELLPKLTKNSWVILEMSSFQLIDMTLSPYIAVVLNITEDHLDWHKNRKEYVEAKKNIVRYQSASDWAVINEEYETSRNFAKYTKGKVIFFSKKTLDKKFKEDLLLRGEHNLENIAAAVAVAKVLEIKEKATLEVISNFKGLEHRLELVKKVGGVSFYNDSFATGPQPTIAAIKSFTEPITIILGGSEKGLDYEELGREITKAKNIKTAIIIGEIGHKIIVALKKAKYRGAIVNLKKSPMQKIVENAYRNTSQGGVVILSPAAASFDMFANYKDRGNQFKNEVMKLRKQNG